MNINDCIEAYSAVKEHGRVATMQQFEGFLIYGDIDEAPLDSDLYELLKTFEKNTGEPVDRETELRLAFVNLIRAFASGKLLKSGHVCQTSA